MFLTSVIFFFFSMPLLFAAVNDATTMKIPNWISLVMMAGFFLIVPFTWQGIADFLTHIAVGLTFLFAGFGLFSIGRLGAGDGKLMAATGLWLTWPDAMTFTLYTAVFGGLLGLSLLVGRSFIPVRMMTSQWMHTMFRDQTKMPYGLAIAAGGICTIPKSAIFQVALGI